MDTLRTLALLLGIIGVAVSQSTLAAPAATTKSNKKFLNITAMLNAPYLLYANYEKKAGDYVGFIPDLLDILAERMNFDYNIYSPADTRYGSPNPDGTWTGMMGEVIKGDADLAVGLTVNHNRSEVVDFTFPIQSADPAIVMHKPIVGGRDLVANLYKLLEPMGFSVWLMVVLAFLVTSTVLYIIAHTNPYDWRRMAKDKEATLREAESFTCLNSFWFVISTLAWQGFVRAPRSMGGRITVTAWWFFVLIFILSYTASLTNYLRVGPDASEAMRFTEIQGFKDLADRDDYMVAMLPGGATQHGFQKSPFYHDNTLYKKSVEFEKKYKKLTSPNDGIEYMRRYPARTMALIMEAPTAKYIVNRKPCDLFMVTDPRNSRFISMATKKKSPLIQSINTELLKLYESGKMTSLERHYFDDTMACEKSVLDTRAGKAYYKVPPFYRMDLGTFSGALLILVVGLVLGGVTTVIELCIYKWAEMHPDEQDEPMAEEAGQNNITPNDHLLAPDTKKGGATQV